MRQSQESQECVPTRHGLSKLIVQARPRAPRRFSTPSSHPTSLPAAETARLGISSSPLDGADFENREYWNFGCASQRNLAAMVENPADLVQPRGEVAVYAARRSTVLDKYRKGENPSTVYTSEKDGKISDVGK